MTFPGFPLATDKANATLQRNIHPLAHNQLAAAVNDLQDQITGAGGNATLGADNVFTGFNSFEHGLIVQGGDAQRIPAAVNVTIKGDTLLNGSDLVNKVGLALGVNFTGGFTAEAAKGAIDPFFVFGANDYILTGTTTGDIAGLTDFWGRLVETHNRTPGAVINQQKTLIAQSYVDEATAHSNNIVSMEVYGPAGAGTADNAYGLLVHPPTIGTNKFALFVGSAPSQFDGDVSLSSTKLDVHNGTIAVNNLNVGPDGVTGGLGANLSIKPVAGAGGLAIIAAASPTIDMIRVMDNGGSPRFRVNKNAYIMIGVNAAPADADITTNEVAFWFDQTSGAAKLKIKGKDGGGTVRTGEVALT